MTAGPVFIGGCDRSGTTMLGDILGSAPGAVVTPESQFVHELMLLSHQRAFSQRAAAADWLLGHFRFAAWGLAIDPTAVAACVDLDDPRTTVENLLRVYCRERGIAAGRWIDHTPDNARYHGLLARWFPDARFIHLVRDGRAVFHSIRPLSWGPNNAYSATRYWSERLERGLQMEIAHGDRCRRIRYEDLLAAPEQVILELCRWLAFPYREEMLRGGALRLPEFTHRQHRLVGRRPDPGRIDRWRKRLSTAQIETFEAFERTRVHLAACGYALAGAHRRKVSTPLAIGYYLHDGLRYGLNRLRHRRTERRTVRARLGRKLGPIRP